MGHRPAFVCPRCRGSLESSADRHHCRACGSIFPVCCGIADFRIDPDPYISIDDDRRKGERLHREAAGRSFADLLRCYYAMTPEDPADLAERWIAHALQETAIATTLLRDAGLTPATAAPPGALLDVGCSTGALLIAAAGSYGALVGVDVAFRWLVVGQARLREAGIEATLVCANGEHLPFADSQFESVTAIDVLEHARDARAMVREARRVSLPGGRTLCTSNNRYWPGLEPSVRLWGVGLLPRRWQPAWVAAWRHDLHPYRIILPSAPELVRAFRGAQYRTLAIEPAVLVAPRPPGPVLGAALGAYNALRRLPVIRQVLRLVGPRLRVLGER